MWNILLEIIQVIVISCMVIISDTAIIPTIESITTGMQVLQTPDGIVPAAASKYYI